MQTNTLVGILFLILQGVYCQSGDSEWMDSHTWAKLTDDTKSTDLPYQCQAISTNSEDALALTYFKRFVNLLFSRKRLKYDEISMRYKRTVLFTLLPAQVDELESINDVRDLDILLSKIIRNAKDAPMSTDKVQSGWHTQLGGVSAYLKEIYGNIVQLLKSAQVQFMLMFVLLILCAWQLMKKRSALYAIFSIIGLFLFIGFIWSYLECNRKLEIEQMFQAIENNQPQLDAANQSWYTRLFSFMTGNSLEAQKKEKLLKSSKIHFGICRPDHMLFTYVNELLLKNLETLVKATTETMTSLHSSLPFPFNYIGSIIPIILIGYILKWTIKYCISPNAWANVINGRYKEQMPPIAQQEQPTIGNETNVDRLSGENLKILLNVLSINNVTQQKPQLAAVSGVQELLGAEHSECDGADKLDESDSSSSSSTAQASGFTLVDDVDNDHADNVTSL